jgi:hypothetical protein
MAPGSALQHFVLHNSGVSPGLSHMDFACSPRALSLPFFRGGCRPQGGGWGAFSARDVNGDDFGRSKKGPHPTAFGGHPPRSRGGIAKRSLAATTKPYAIALGCSRVAPSSICGSRKHPTSAASRERRRWLLLTTPSCASPRAWRPTTGTHRAPANNFHPSH